MSKNRFLLKFAILLLSASASFIGVSAQEIRQEILSDIENLAGIYSVYPDAGYVQTPAPDGYKPFYISHFGRHGSRWHSGARHYERPLEKLREGAEAGLLTETGKEVYGLIAKMAEDARGRYGHLTPRGTREHRDIAERMYRSFPEVFSTAEGKPCRIEAYSSTVVRCVLSMAASNERLKELNPAIEISRCSYDSNMDEIFCRTGRLKRNEERPEKFSDSNSYKKVCKPERLLETLFTDWSFIPEDSQWEMLYDMYLLAASCREVDYLGIDLFKYLVPEDIYPIWECRNALMYWNNAASAQFSGQNLGDAVPSLKHMVECADDALSTGNISATLRYGHDWNIVPLAALMGIEGCDSTVSDPAMVKDVWLDFEVTPMAANIQLIFFRKDGSDDILVKVMLNEKETRLELDSDILPYYRWDDLRKYFISRM